MNAAPCWSFDSTAVRSGTATISSPAQAPLLRIKIPTAYVRSARLCAARNDVRFYLNGACIEVIDECGYIVATDGRILFAAKFSVPTGTPDCNVIVPRELLYVSRKTKAETVLFEITEQQVAVSAFAGTMGRVGCAIKGKFPDWRGIVPKSPSDQVAQFSAHQIARLCAVAKLIQPEPSYFGIRNNGPNTAVSVLDEGNAMLIFTPLLTQKGPSDVPTWATVPEQAVCDKGAA